MAGFGLISLTISLCLSGRAWGVCGYSLNDLFDRQNSNHTIQTMTTHLRSTKFVLEELKCGRSTFYHHLKICDVSPIKQGNKSYFSPEQINILKESLYHPKFQTNKDKQRTDDRQNNGTKKEQSKEFTDYLKAELERKNQAFEIIQKQVQELSGQVGHWQGTAQAYQEQNIKLLEEKKQRSEVVEAEILEESIPIKPKSFWKKFWSE